ncbi:MAG: hypothetical protein NTY53_16025 [Kiritimatiellaeota bacterium]|nr:hypothetical protein [Kiritimatiellota bacterium]
MAEIKRFICSHCRYLLEASDEGHPYFLSDEGKPQFFSQSSREKQLEEFLQQSAGRPLTGTAREDFLAQRTGKMSDLLCLDCGSKFKRDLGRQEAICPGRKCHSKNVAAVWQLEGKTCPSCTAGRFKLKRLIANS